MASRSASRTVEVIEEIWVVVVRDLITFKKEAHSDLQ